jgi:hypothetical protein
MFRAASISLVLMGTGLVGYAATQRGNDPCVQARAANRPDADTVCASSSSRSSSPSSSHYYGGSGGARATSIAAGAAAGAAIGSVSRGGFGSSGAAHAGSSGS